MAGERRGVVEHPAQTQRSDRELAASDAPLAGGGSVTPPQMSQFETQDDYDHSLFADAGLSEDAAYDGLGPGFLCDRLTVCVPVVLFADVAPELGGMWLIDPSGGVEGFRDRRRVLEGSWDTRCTVEIVQGAKLYVDLLQEAENLGGRLAWFRVDGNPGKWWTGTNVYGSADVGAMVEPFVLELLGLVGMRPGENCYVYTRRGYFTRIDATINFELASFSEASSLVRQLGRYATVSHRRSTTFDGSVVFPGRISSLTVYHKGPEMRAHPPRRDIPGLLEVADKIVRFEVVSRSERLDRLGLRPVAMWKAGAPSSALLMRLWWSFVARIRFPMMGHCDLTVLAPASRRAYSVWLSGQDVVEVMSRASAYRHRGLILAAGGPDILLPKPDGDVIQFRRVLRPRVSVPSCEIAELITLPVAA